MTDTRITEALLKMLETKLSNKRSEMDGFSQPIIDRSAENNHRKFQVEVEYWQLHGLVADIKSLVESLTASV